MPRSSTTDPAANSMGWRLANSLAIASPYLIAAAVFLFLYIGRTPPARSVNLPQPAPPPVSAGGASIPVEAESAAPVSLPSAVNPQPAPHKSPSLPAQHEAPLSPPHPPASRPVSPHEQAPGQPVFVDPAVAATMKLSGDPPAYPAIAHAAGVQGTVVLALTIAPDGSVTDARAVSGPDLLQPATIAAVRSWRYRPWLVYGKITPFQTQVSIEFKIVTRSP